MYAAGRCGGRGLRRAKIAIVGIGLIAFVAILLVPLPGAEPSGDGALTPGARSALAVFVLAVSLWVTNAIPLGITGLLAVALLDLLVYFDRPGTALSYFGNEAVFFMLGVFVIAASMIKTGLSKRLTLALLRRFDRSPRALIAGVFVVCFLLSLCMPEHAVAAMVLPIVLEIARELKLIPRESRMGKALFIAMAWGCVSGGIGTLLGGARGPLALSLLRQDFPGVHVPTFLEWAIAAVPVAVLVGSAGLGLILLLFRPEIESVRAARTALADEFVKLHRLSRSEKKLAAIAVLTVLAWIVLNQFKVSLAAIAVLGAVAVIASGATKWDEIRHLVNWGVLLMYGGAVAVGYTLRDTGAMAWVIERIVGAAPVPPFVLFAGLVIVTIALTETISNAAALVIVLPVAFTLAAQAGIPPERMSLIAYVVALPAGMAFALPIGTPPNAMAFSSHYLRVSDMVRAGVILNTVAIGILLLIARFYWPLLGLRWW